VKWFYQEHAALVSQAMRISLGKAQAYCERGRDEVLERGAAALADWEPRRVLELADLAMASTGHYAESEE
jgi:hypothetical protein